MEQINSRTMEILRMLGLADKLRNTEGVVGVDAPWRVLHCTGLGDPVPEFARVVSFVLFPLFFVLFMYVLVVNGE